MKRLNTAAPSAPAREPGRFDPSTWAGQARNMAHNDADAITLLAAIVVSAALAVGAFATRRMAGWQRIDLLDVLVLAGGVVLALACVWIATYAWALRRDTAAVRRATWAAELDSGDDIDGDGQVGPPRPVGHVVRISGARPAEVVLPDLDPPRELAPLVEFPATPPVTANDVIYILSEAARSGLTFRAWERRRLPSGAEIDRTLWVGIQDGLVSWTFAVAETDARGRRHVALRSDVGVETMIHAVRVGAGMDME